MYFISVVKDGASVAMSVAVVSSRCIHRIKWELALELELHVCMAKR